MEVLYEESALNQKSKKLSKVYAAVNVIFWIAVVIAIWLFVTTVMSIPFKDAETSEEEYQIAWINVIGQFVFIVLVVLFALFANFVKSRINISYDYAFVSGELRISRVVNINKRKFLCDINPEEILQIGDVEGSDFERLSSDPQTKTVVCTPNETAGEGKFFLYVLAVENGKKLYVLECREELLLNMMQFLRRDILDRDYIPQAKKAMRK